MQDNDEDVNGWKAFANTMKNARQQRHADWKKQNTALLQASGIPFTSTNNGETLCIRERARPRVDFYPSTGRFRIDNLRTLGGHAEFLIQWYREHTDGR